MTVVYHHFSAERHRHCWFRHLIGWCILGSLWVGVPHTGFATINLYTTYAFSTAQTSYVSLTTGTVHTSGTVTEFSVLNVSLGFPFWWYGQWVTNCNIDLNGYIWFGSANYGNQDDPLYNLYWSGGVPGVIAPLSGDFQGLPSTVVRSQTVGSAPNRVFIVEWQHVSRQGSWEDLTDYTFQLRLYESPKGRIEFWYGTMEHAGSVVSTTVGLGRRVASVDAVSIAVGWGIPWQQPSVQGSAWYSASLSETQEPPEGLLYRWEPDEVDVGAVELLPPPPITTGNVTVSLAVENRGVQAVTHMTIAWWVDGVTQSSVQWNGTFPFASTLTITLGSVQLPTAQLVQIIAQVNVAGDQQSSNNELFVHRGKALGGDYTIGGTNGTFSTFEEAINYTSTVGLYQPVTFHVRTGVYRERLLLGSDPPAMGGPHPIVFTAENLPTTGSIPSITSLSVWIEHATAPTSAAENFLLLVGAPSSTVIFRGIGFRATAATQWCQAVYAGEFARLEFDRCAFVSPQLTSGTIANMGFFYTSEVTPIFIDDPSWCIVTNSIISGGYYGIYADGDRLGIYHSRLQLQYMRGVYLSDDHSQCRIIDVSIEEPESSAAGYAAIRATDDIEGGEWRRNFIRLRQNGSGTGFELDDDFEGIIAENIIVGGEASITFDWTYGSLLIAHNVFWTTSPGGVSCLLDDVNYITMQNNIFLNTGGGKALVYEDIDLNWVNLSSEHNGLFTTGSVLGSFNGVDVTDVTGFQQFGVEGNSVGADPLFVGFPASVTSASWVQPRSWFYIDRGTSATGVTTDWNGTPWNTPPDIGAFEVGIFSGVDVGLLRLQGPAAPVTAGNHTVAAVIWNNGSTTISTCQIQWWVNGVTQATVTWNGTLAPGTQATVTLGNVAVSASTVTIVARVTNPNNTVDAIAQNNEATLELATGLAGSYVVGTSATADFPNLESAIRALYTRGVLATVTFHVLPVTTAATLRFNGIVPGSSTQHTVTIRSQSGDPNDVTLIGNSPALSLAATGYLRFEGIAFRKNNSDSPVVDGRDTLRHIQFTRCWFIAPVNGNAVVVDLDDAFVHNSLFYGCYVEGGDRGIYFSGGRVVRLDSCVFWNAQNQGVYAGRVRDLQISRCFFEKNTNTVWRYMLTLYRCAQVNVEKSYFRNRGAAWGYQMLLISRSDTVQIANCFFYTDTLRSTHYVLRSTNTSALKIYFSTFVVPSVGQIIRENSTTNWEIKNSIFYLDRGTILNLANVPAVSDYNHFYVRDGDVAMKGGATYTTLAQWQTGVGRDQHSSWGTLQFQQLGEPTVRDPILDQAGVAIAGITEDIRGDSRGTPPDIGADEFDLFPSDVALEAIEGPVSPFSAGVYPVSVVVKNYSLTTIASLQVHWQQNGNTQATVNWNGTLSPGDTVHIALGNAAFNATGATQIVAWTAQPNNQEDFDHSNDTLAASYRAALAGTYVLGTSATADFPSWSAFAALIASVGMVDTVVLEVEDGTYAEAVVLDSIPGNSQDKPLWIRAQNGTTHSVVISTTAAAAFRITGVKAFILEDLRCEATNRIIDIRGRVKSGVLRRIVATSPSAVQFPAFGLYISVADSAAISIEQSRVEHCHTGIYASNVANLTLQSCIVKDVQSWGIDVDAVNMQIERNRVGGDILPGTAMDVKALGGVVSIRNNILAASTRGMQIRGAAMASDPAIVANNVIFVRDTTFGSGRIGVQFFYGAWYWQLFHNTVVVDALRSSACVHTGVAQFVVLQNNVFVNAGGGLGIVQLGTGVTSDYNAWYTTGSVFSQKAGQIQTLPQRQASGLDVHSVFADPGFRTPDSFRPTNVQIDGVGQFVAAVPEDIDGEERRRSQPSAGADEFRIWQVALIAPPDGAVNQPVTTTLVWSALSGASSYAVQVATNAQFQGQLATSAVVTTTTYTVLLQTNQQYWWRVRAQGAAGTSGSWSEEWRFRTIGPVLEFTPTMAQVQVEQGYATNLTVTVENAGQGADLLNVMLMPSITWMGVSVTQLSLASGGSTTVTLQLNTSGTLFQGSYQGTLRFSSNDPDRSVDSLIVQLQVLPNAYDAGIDSLITPAPPFADGVYPVVVRLRNYGTTTLSSVQVYWAVNGVTQATYTWNGTLEVGSSTSVTVTTLSFAIAENYQLRFWSAQPNGQADQFALNDTLSVSLQPKFAGHYRIGNSTTAVIATPQQALTLLRQRGMLDTVWLEIEPGTYVGQLDIDNIPGLGSARPLYLQSTTGDSSDVVLTYAASGIGDNYVVRVAQVTSVTIRALSISATGATYSQALVLDSTVRDFTLQQCVLQSRWLQNDPLLFISNNGVKTDIRIVRNLFAYGGVGLRATGVWYSIWNPSRLRVYSLIIENNHFHDQKSGGIILHQTQNALVRSNVLRSTSATLNYGIRLVQNQIVGASGVQIVANQIWYPNSNGVCIEVWQLATPYGDTLVVLNNGILSSANAKGIHLYVLSRAKVLHNTVRLVGTGANGVGLWLNSAQHCKVYNNLFAVANGAALKLAGNLSGWSSDYNGFFATGPWLVLWETQQYPSLEWWQRLTQQDLHSVFAPPYFTTDTGVVPQQFLLNGAASVAWRVSTDLYGTIRSVTDPDIGAVEFTPLRRDAAVVELLQYAQPVPPGTTTATVIVKNEGSDNITSLQLQWMIDGVVQSPVSWSGQLPPQQQVAVALGNVTLVDQTAKTIKVWIYRVNTQADENTANDTLQRDLAPGLGGIYTVGPGTPPPDFAGIAQAVNALNTYGIYAAVVFQIRSGTYTESVSIAPIRGASTTATVTFVSEADDSSAVVWKASSGNNSYIVHLQQGVGFVSFQSLTFDGNSQSLVQGNGDLRDVRFVNTRFHQRSFGTKMIDFQGPVRDTAIQIVRCGFVGFPTGAGWLPHYAFRCNTTVGQSAIFIDSVEITGCYFGTWMRNGKLLLRQSRIDLASPYRRAVYLTGDVAGSEIRRNWFVGKLEINNASGSSAHRVRVVNNMLTEGSIALYGISFVDVAFNSVRSSMPLDGTVISNSRILNNVLAASAGEQTFDISSLTNTEFDYNAFYTTGQYLGEIGSQRYGSLNALQNLTQTNMHSLVVNPLFVSTTDLHSRQAQLDSAATPLSFVSVDWDGEPRDPNHPDIGADELEVRNNDIGILAIVQPESTCGMTSGTLVTVAVQNYGFNAITSAHISAFVQSTSTSWSVVVSSANLNIAAGDTVHYQFPVAFDLSEPSTYHFRIWTDLANETDRSNDTLQQDVHHIPLISQFPYRERFEVWNGGWLPVGNTVWEWGEPNGGIIATAGEGSKAYVTNLDGAAALPAHGGVVLLSPCFDFSTLTYDPVLKFKHIWTAYALHKVEISTDGGATWQSVGSGWGSMYGGGSSGWQQETIRLQGYVGQSNVRIRFRAWRSYWSANPTEGVGIDDIVLEELPAYDAALIAVTEPENTCRNITQANITLTIANRGGEVITTCGVGWNVTGAIVTSGSVVLQGLNIASESSTTLSIAAKLDISAVGNYTLQVWTALNGDSRHDNDTAVVQIAHLPVYVPGTVASMSPADGSSDLSLPITFSWSAVANATHYDLYIWEATTATRPAQPVQANLTSIRTTYGHLAYGKTYRWQVVAKYVCVDSTVETDGPIYTLSVRHLPDLIVTSISVPATPALAGSSVSFSWKVKNIGQGSTRSAGWYEKVYLSQDASLATTGDNIYLGRVRNLSFLLPGESYTRTESFRLPDVLQGNFWVFVVIDGRVLEERTDNNRSRSASQLQVTLPPRPDLIITQGSGYPTTVFGNDTITVHYTVKNDGNLFVAPQNIRISAGLESATQSIPIRTNTFSITDTLFVGETTTGSIQLVIPHTVVGKYFLYLFVDATDQVKESAENNNLWYSDTLTVKLFPPPDLVPIAIGGTTATYSGRRYSLTWTVQNQGLNPVQESGWVDRVYLCSTAVFQRSAVVDSFAVVHANTPQLQRDSSYTVTQQLFIPNGLSGTFYWFVYTDAGNAVFEYYATSESNNLKRSAAVQIQVPPTPDLIVRNLQSSTTAVYSGDTVSLQWTIENRGDTAATGWWDKVTLAKSSVWDPGQKVKDVALVQYTGTVQRSASVTIATVVRIPANLNPGVYYLYVQTDARNDWYEHQGEGNNRSTIPAAIQVERRPGPPPSDLAVTLVAAPSTTHAGLQVSVTYQVANVGTGNTAGHYRYDVVRVIDTTGGNNRTIAQRNVWISGRVAFPYQRTVELTIPEGTEGQHLYSVTIGRDALDTNRVNDVTTASLTVQLLPTPDLTIRQVTLPSVVTAGTIVTMQYEVANIGTGATRHSWVDKVYLNATPTLNRAIPIAWKRHSSLGAGQHRVVTLQPLLPSYLVGNYYLIFRTDVADDVYEGAGEQNNLLVTTITILPAQRSDLVVSSIVIPTTATLGDPVTVQYRVQNVGTSAAVGVNTDGLFWSSDQTFDGAVDPFFGERSYSIHLSPGAQTGWMNFTAPLYEVDVTQSQHSVIRTNLRMRIDESNVTNNTAVSTTAMVVQVRTLTLGVTTQTALPAGRRIYYKLDVPVGNDVLLEVNSDKNVGSNEVYVRYGQVPTLAQFDFSHRDPYGTDQIVLIPDTRQGSYYIMVRNLTGQDENLTLYARSLPFSIIRITPDTMGQGQVTCRVFGARFTDSTFFYLRDPATNEIISTAATLHILSRMEAEIRWLLHTVSTGTYHLYAANGTTATAGTQLDSAVVVETARPYFLGIATMQPRAVMIRRPALIVQRFENRSNVDIPVVIGDIAFATTVEGVLASDNCFLIRDFSIPNVVNVEEAWYTYADSASGHSFGIIPFLVQDLAPGQTFTIAARVIARPIARDTTPQGNVRDVMRAQVRALGMDNERYLLRLFQRWEILRTGIEENPEPFLQDNLWRSLALTATDRAAFRDSMMLAYLTAGWLEEEDTVGYRLLSAAFDSVMVWWIDDSGDGAVAEQEEVLPPESAVGGCSTCGLQKRHPQQPVGFVDAVIKKVCEIFETLRYYVGWYRCAKAVISCVQDARTAILLVGASGGTVGWGVAALLAAKCGWGLYSDCMNAPEPETFVEAAKVETGSALVSSFEVGVKKGYSAPVWDPKKGAYIQKVKVEDLRVQITKPDASGRPRPVVLRQTPGQYAKAVGKDVAVQVALKLLEWAMSKLCEEYLTPSIAVLIPKDPNEIVGPPGIGPERLVGINRTLAYQIKFENVSTASAPAQRVEITLPLDDDLDPRTVRLGIMGFGPYVLDVPENKASLTKLYDLPDSLGFDLRVTAGIDVVNHQLFWHFQTIDPATQMPPLATQPQMGFLPPNDSTGRGQGFVNFTIRSYRTATTGDTLLAQATIVFDQNEPLSTNVWSNRIEGKAPWARLRPLPPFLDTTLIVLHWAPGQDDSLGIGVQDYDLFVAIDGGPWQEVARAIEDTTYKYIGERGRTYAFFVIARDSVGNTEWQDTAEAFTMILPPALQAQIAAYLQGPYQTTTGTMHTLLNQQQYLPLTDPYGTNTTIASITTAVVDWVLVELRAADDSSSVVARKPALLRSDGTLLDTNQQAALQFLSVAPGDYYVAIRHRNHIAIMSTTPVTFAENVTVQLSFTASSTAAFQVTQTPLVNLAVGVYGIPGGDVHPDGIINAWDRVAVRSAAGSTGYLPEDATMDGVVDAADRALVRNNTFRVTQVP